MNNKWKAFALLAVEVAGYKTPQRAVARCRSTFRGIELRGKDILDVGAGTGVLSAYAVVSGARRVVALEPAADGSSAGIDDRLARMRDGLNQAQFIVSRQSLQEYLPKAAEFDIVVMYNTVNHLHPAACGRLHRDPNAVRSYQRLFEHVRRLLRVGGLLLIADCSRHNFFGMFGLKNPLAPMIVWPAHQSPRTWERVIVPLGFTRRWLSWYVPYPLRRLPWLTASGAANYFLWSHFVLVLEYSDENEAPARGFSLYR